MYNSIPFLQVELLSPSVQTPRALGIFCALHLAVSIALDVTVGLVTKLQYLLLLGIQNTDFRYLLRETFEYNIVLI